MEKLGFGVIGCGFIGMLHAGVIAALDGAYLAAVADSDAEKQRRQLENGAAEVTRTTMRCYGTRMSQWFLSVCLRGCTAVSP